MMTENSMGASRQLGSLGQDDTAAKSSKWHKAKPTMDNWLAYKGLTADDNAYFELVDGTFAEMMAVEGIGLAQLPDSQIQSVTDGFTNFWRHYLEDITIITTPFPATTTSQQVYWYHKLERAVQEARKATDDRKRQVWIARKRYSSDRIKAAKAVEEQLQNQEYIMIFFGRSVSEVQALIDTAMQFSGAYLQLKRLSADRKQLMAFRINNMNVRV